MAVETAETLLDPVEMVQDYVGPLLFQRMVVQDYDGALLDQGELVQNNVVLVGELYDQAEVPLWNQAGVVQDYVWALWVQIETV